MGDSIQVKITGLEEAQKYFNALAVLSPEKLLKIVGKAGKLIESEAKENCSVGVTGDLRRKIHSDLNEREFSATIGVFSEIGPYIEFGTMPHMPPVEALVKWVDKNFDTQSDTVGVSHEEESMAGAWALAMKIKNEGTPPRPYLYPAVEKVKPEYVEMLKQGVRSLF